MKYLFDKWNSISKKIKGLKILLCFDYDGTLTPIAKKPEYAKLDFKTRNILKNVCKNKKFILMVISGRPLSEIRKMVKLRDVIYAGNHGFEIEIKKCNFVHQEAEIASPIIKEIRKIIENKIKMIPGAFVEDKKFTLSIHWRLVNKKYLRKLFSIIKNVIHNNKKIKLTKGKKVWEIRPNINWDKGKALLWVLSRLSAKRAGLHVRYPLLPVYVGDDTTDEDAFKALKCGITVKVGKSNKSKAGYYLKSQQEVVKFLKILN
ncbi:MAG: trehalose-phosphatase [Elusimicrobia bacterium RIFOXYD2_FULL_34_15]|nr:MAG: trehalose-phosphatase [Elusimicrobia bacterium RIFOXYD2_FULL_34_15]